MAEIEAIDPRSVLAKRLFPKEWDRANRKPQGASKARNSLRKRAEDRVKLDSLRAAGANCASCRSFSPYPGSKGRMMCDHGSDFHGYQEAFADDLCGSWGGKT